MHIKYKDIKFNPKKLNPQNINRMAIERIKKGSMVLDIGCAAGSIGEYLKKKMNCKVYGIEERKSEAEAARQKLDKVFLGDIENEKIIKEIIFKKKKFDVVLCLSLLEHLKNPDKILLNIKKLLNNNGLLIASTPNIANWRIRLSLLFGNFEYTQFGILDNTHLHFFTKKTFKEIFLRNGFEVIEEKIDAEGGGFPRVSIILSRFFPGIFAYQMLIAAKLKK